MLKKATAYLLILLIVTMGLSRCFIYAGFAINKDYIANTLCVNKAKPKINCKGKCYLSKKLKQAEEKEKNTEGEGQKSKYQEAFLSRVERLQIPLVELSFAYAELMPDAAIHRSSLIFHPPKA
ncbi:hypothetical protein [Pedobacter sp. SYSU D00535]|uniref:hypothetical protein n=1 Tax=Pedobacter sp. SYSU D00535 TaxID=2810308 RepID=UPI001A95FAB2|nr:hypothetical protein [Pedobacter sp. SYSU D00535]